MMMTFLYYCGIYFIIMAKEKKKSNVIAENRKARFNYIIEETLECGIVLKGTEVKSIRAAKFSFPDAFVEIRHGELFIRNLNITPYDYAGVFNHKSEGARKLLAHKKEIEKLQRKVNEKGYTLVPLKFYLKQSLVKVEVALCKGKKMFDKRNSIKERDNKRDLERQFRVK